MALSRTAVAVAAAILIAMPAEGLRQFAYYDPPGILSVCYGSTTDVKSGRRYSLEECRDRLNQDMRQAVATVERCAPGAPLNVLTAFADAVYNIGPKIVCDVRQSKAARYLQASQWMAACRELTKWDKAKVAGVMVPLPGLTKRRAVERSVCELA